MRKGSEGECAMPLGTDGTQTQVTRAKRGHNHARRRGAIAAAAVLCGVLLLPALPSAQSLMPLPAPSPGAFAAPVQGEFAAPMPAQFSAPVPADNPLVQRDVPAEAVAENAVMARDQALVAGQRIAYERMAAAMGLPLNIPDRQIEAMVSSLIIESERITPRGYSARITVNFDPAGTGPRPPQAPPPTGVAVASVEAVARYRSFRDYVDLTRRLAAQPAVARVEVLSVSGEAARLRLGLRSQPDAAAAELAQGGLVLGQGAPGEGWRIGLAGGR